MSKPLSSETTGTPSVKATDTPRTDAALINSGLVSPYSGRSIWYVDAEFARQLERDLAAKQQELDFLIKLHKQVCDRVTDVYEAMKEKGYIK